MTGFRADLAALDELIGRMSAFDRRAATVADQLESEARRLQAHWNGPAADAHSSAHRRWLTAHEQVRGVLGELTGFVRGAHANYAAASAANVRMWG